MRIDAVCGLANPTGRLELERLSMGGRSHRCTYVHKELIRGEMSGDKRYLWVKDRTLSEGQR